jgi:hypothetical protein
MKRLVLGAAVAGGATLPFRRLAGMARKMHGRCNVRCRNMMPAMK